MKTPQSEDVILEGLRQALVDLLPEPKSSLLGRPKMPKMPSNVLGMVVGLALASNLIKLGRYDKATACAITLHITDELGGK